MSFTEKSAGYAGVEVSVFVDAHSSPLHSMAVSFNMVVNVEVK